MSFDFWNRKRTNYGGGGLLAPMGLVHHPNLLKTPNFLAPKYQDHTPCCMPADDQGQTSKCAAYAMAGLLEVYNWMKKRVPEAYAPDPIYARAKAIDGNDFPGTYLESVFSAAKDLGHLKQDAEMVILRSLYDVKFALFEYDVCLAGFHITEGWNNTNTKTGWIGNEPRGLGGHAVLLNWYCDYGHQDDGVGWTNSWGLDNWGLEGKGRMRIPQFREQFMYGLAIKGGFNALV